MSYRPNQVSSIIVAFCFLLAIAALPASMLDEIHGVPWWVTMGLTAGVGVVLVWISLRQARKQWRRELRAANAEPPEWRPPVKLAQRVSERPGAWKKP